MRRALRTLPLTVLLAVVITTVLSLVTTSETSAAKPPKPPNCTGCPRPCVACADVYDPVICSDGQVYGNSCYAYVACATGCVPYGDGGPIEVE